MAILEKFVEVTPNSRSLKHYRNLGYDAKMGIPLKVSINDLTDGSRVNVTCICDNCGAERIQKYNMYTLITKRNTKGKYFCVSCANRTDEKKEKIKQTNLERYGVTTTLLVPEVQEKIKQTNLERYGVEYPRQNKEVAEKLFNTMEERYGVKYSMQCPEIRQKAEETNIEKYGTSVVLQNPIIRDKIQQTNIEKYGVPFPSQNPNIIAKQQQTMLERYGATSTMLVPELKQKVWDSCIEHYGTPFPFQVQEVIDRRTETNIKKYGGPSPTNDPEVRRKQALALQKNGNISTSKQQRYLWNLLGGELNGVVSHFNCDIVFYDRKYIVEYDGGAHNFKVMSGQMSQEEFDQRQRKRFYVVKQAGFSQIRIISRQDRLPSDEVIQDIVKQSEQYFATTEHTWINWDIDSGCFYNYLNPDGVEYDFGPLRKIKNEEVA